MRHYFHHRVDTLLLLAFLDLLTQGAADSPAMPSECSQGQALPDGCMGGWADGWGSPLWVATLKLESAPSLDACRALL